MDVSQEAVVTATGTSKRGLRGAQYIVAMAQTPLSRKE